MSAPRYVGSVRFVGATAAITDRDGDPFVATPAVRGGAGDYTITLNEAFDTAKLRCTVTLLSTGEEGFGYQLNYDSSTAIGLDVFDATTAVAGTAVPADPDAVELTIHQVGG